MAGNPHGQTIVQRLREVPERVAVLEEARGNADERQDRHEETCGERYASLDGQIERVHARIDSVFKLGIMIAVSTVMTLIAVVAPAILHPH